MLPSVKFLVSTAFMALLAMDAVAQTSPPIRPGLWEITSDYSVDGKRVMSLNEQMANATPAQRAWAERFSKSETNVQHTCLTAEVLANGRWHGVTPKCSTRYSVKDGTQWKWHSTCQQNEIDGEAFFNSPEGYRTNTVTMLNGTGTTHVVTANASMRWVAPTCEGAR